MEKQKEFLEHLKQNHTGRDKAVCSKELERLFSLNGRTIRRIISSLRQDGNPICSSGKGYYFARTQDEINETVSRLNGLVTGVSNARTGLLYRTPQWRSLSASAAALPEAGRDTR